MVAIPELSQMGTVPVEPGAPGSPAFISEATGWYT